MAVHPLRAQLLEAVSSAVNGQDESAIVDFMKQLKTLETQDLEARAALAVHENALKTQYAEGGWNAHCSFEYFCEHFAEVTGAAPDKNVGLDYLAAKQHSTKIWLDYCDCKTNIETLITDPTKILRDAGIPAELASKPLFQQIPVQAALQALEEKDFIQFKTKQAAAIAGHAESIESAQREVKALRKPKSLWSQLTQLADMNFNVVKFFQKRQQTELRIQRTEQYITKMQDKTEQMQWTRDQFAQAEQQRKEGKILLTSKQKPYFNRSIEPSRYHRSKEMQHTSGIEMLRSVFELEADEELFAGATPQNTAPPRHQRNENSRHAPAIDMFSAFDSVFGDDELLSTRTPKNTTAWQEPEFFDARHDLSAPTQTALSSSAEEEERYPAPSDYVDAVMEGRSLETLTVVITNDLLRSEKLRLHKIQNQTGISILDLDPVRYDDRPAKHMDRIRIEAHFIAVNAVHMHDMFAATLNMPEKPAKPERPATKRVQFQMPSLGSLLGRGRDWLVTR